MQTLPTETVSQMNKQRRKQISLLKANLQLARVHIALAVQCMNKAKLLKRKGKA